MTERPDTLAAGFRSIARHLPRRRRWQAGGVLVLMLMGAVAELVTLGAVVPLLAVMVDPAAASKSERLGKLVGFLSAPDGTTSLGLLAAVFCGIALVAAAIRITLAWGSQKFVYRVGYDLGTSLYTRMLYQNYTFHVGQNSAKLIASINKVQKIITRVIKPLMQGVSAAVISIFIIAGLIFISPMVALSSVGIFGSIYVLTSYMARKVLSKNSVIISKTNGQRIQAVQEGLGGIRDVIIDSSQPVYLKKFSRIDAKLRDAQATNALIAVVPRYVIESVGMVLIVGLAVTLQQGAGGLQGALPVLGAFALGAQRLMPQLQLVYNGWAQLAGNRAMFLDIVHLLDQPMPSDLKQRAKTAMPFERDIAFKAVHFRYPSSEGDVLASIDLVIPKGARIGFIGKTGSGKSTIIDLVMGLLAPASGQIQIDGHDLTVMNVHQWQMQLAHVPQQIYLADSSFLENIAFGVAPKLIDREKAFAAAVQADIHDFIMAQPKGYDSHVGERGVRLSGGQRQRIGIARALYKQSSVLILDEATSALDDNTEAAVMQAVDGLARDLTVVMIAHRLTTLRGCDVIYRLEEGRIVESGSYREMIGILPVHEDASLAQEQTS